MVELFVMSWVTYNSELEEVPFPFTENIPVASFKTLPLT
jgi:hypothetical protein